MIPGFRFLTRRSAGRAAGAEGLAAGHLPGVLVPLLLACLLLVPSPALADEVPAEFHGVWSLSCADRSAPRIALSSGAITITVNGADHVYTGINVSSTWYGGSSAPGDRVWLPTSAKPDDMFAFVAAPPPFGQAGTLILEAAGAPQPEAIQSLFAREFHRC